MDYEKNMGKVPDYEVIFDEERNNEKGGGLSIMKKLFKSYFGSVVISTVLLMVKHCPIWIIPLITANVINIASNPESSSMTDLAINITVLFLLCLQNIPTHILYSRYTDRMLRNIGAGLRNTLIKKLQSLSVMYHKQIESGRVQAKFLRDIEAVEFFNAHFIKSVIPSVISVIVAIGISAYKSGIVTLFFLIVIPINVLLVFLFQKKIKSNNSLFRKETENISAKVANMLEMIPVTKAHGLENEEIVAIESNIEALREKGLILDKTNAYFGSTMWVISQIMSGICLLFTGFLAYIGKIEVGDIVIYQTYFSSITGNVQALINIYPELAKGLESVHSVSEIMLSDNIEDNKGKIKLRYVHGTVRFDNVSYRYPDGQEDVIKDFSLHVEPGEVIAFVGASGSGKTTIMNMIIGFMMPVEGSMTIDGKPIEMLNLTDYRHFISVVPQNSILFMGTIRENITYGLHDVSEEQLQKVIDLANIREFLDDLPNGLDTIVGENGTKLSGGQRQRISIARALIRDPKILILDEATSALDNISEYHVQKAMSTLIQGRTTFIVAHRLSTIRDADRIVVMEDGCCVELGTYDELMEKKGKFYELKTLSDLR